MNPTDETVVELSKKKIVLIILAAGGFVAAGVHFLSFDEEYIRSERSFGFFFNNPTYVYGIGIAAIVFFGLVGLFAIKKLFDRKPGLVFNNLGIVDNASFVAAGLIPWSDVVGAEIFEIQSQKILIIKVSDPQKYFQRGNSIKRAFNKGGYNGNPIGVPSIALKIKFPELVTLFNEYQRKSGNTHSQRLESDSQGHGEIA
jgi:hypothetical protein